MSVLDRTIRRDLIRQRWQCLSIAVTVFLGVALFAASYDSFLNLESSYRRTYERLAFADLTITGGDSTLLVDRALEYDGVAASTTRRVADIGLRVDGEHTLQGRIIEVPLLGQPAVNRLDLLNGAWPSAPDKLSVLVERHMGDHFELGPSSRIEVRSAGSWMPVDVAALVVSPEYIWPARSRQDLLTSSDDFGVIFASSPVFDELATGSVTETLFRFVPGIDAGELTGRLAAPTAGSAVTVTARADQPSNAALQEDVSGFGDLALLFPILFLGAATMAAFIMLGRLVRSQQPQIATLRANGFGSGRIVRHYIAEGAMLTTIAGIAGLIAGVIAGRLVTGLYTDAISVPDTVTGVHVTTIAAGVALAVGTGAVAAAAPARMAARTEPAASLRGTAPTGTGGRSRLEQIVPALRRLPARWRMVLRGLGRDRRRSLSTAAGVVLSLTLILASWGMVDTVDVLIDRQFEEVQRQDAQIYIDGDTDAVIAAVASVEGVERVEEVVLATTLVSANGRVYTTELVGFAAHTEMHGFGSAGAPQKGVVAGRSLQALLDVDIGDSVILTLVDGSAALALPVEGFVDEPLGTFVYAGLATLQALDPTIAATSAMITFAPGNDRDVLRGDITDVPGVAGYVDSRSLYDTARGLLSLFYAFVGVMLAFGAVMAFALIFNTTAVNTAQRSSELAAMKVNGVSDAQLGRLLAAENLFLTALSIVPGLIIGYGVSAFFMASFSSDLFDFGLQMRGRTLVLAAASVLIAAAVAQWPATRAIARLDVARVVRERAQ